MNSDKEPVSQPPKLHELAENTVQLVNAGDALLKAGIVVPEGHTWVESGDRLSWWLGCPVKSSEAGVSLFIYRTPVTGVTSDELCSDKATISVEVRLFMPESRYRDGTVTHTYRQHSGESFSAHLWVKTGPHWAFKSTSHLVEKEPYVYADSMEALCTEVIRRVNTALSRAAEWIVQQGVAQIEETAA